MYFLILILLNKKYDFIMEMTRNFPIFSVDCQISLSSEEKIIFNLILKPQFEITSENYSEKYYVIFSYDNIILFTDIIIVRKENYKDLIRTIEIPMSEIVKIKSECDFYNVSIISKNWLNCEISLKINKTY